ncbi:MAG: hypothetical protein WDO12_06990 [Pseudomonadota bacterium]
MIILRILGAAIIILWLVLWLAVKVTFGAIHLLVLLGIVMLVAGFMKSASR